MFVDHNGVEIEINNRKMTKHSPSIQKLKNTLVVHTKSKRKHTGIKWKHTILRYI